MRARRQHHHPAPAAPSAESHTEGTLSRSAWRQFTGWPARLRPAEPALVLALLLVALAVRLPYLWTIPRFTDETAEIEFGLHIARGGFLPLTNRDPYIGALWNYILAAGFLAGGPSLLTPRAIVAVLGALTMVPAYLLGRSLAGGSRFGGTVCGLLLALAPMHIVVNSHIAWSNCTTPLFTTFGLWLVHRAISRDRPASLIPAGLAFGLALQTHPVGALLLPGVAAAVVLARPRWLLGPWPWLAGIAAVLGAGNLLAANLWGGIDSLAAGSAVQAGYTNGQELTPAVYLERLRLATWLLADSLGGALAETGQVGGPLAATLAGRLGLILLLLTAGGVVIRARRRDLLPLLALASYLLLLPAINGRFEAAVPKARYITPLLPLCFALVGAALVATRAWIARRATAREIGSRPLAGSPTRGGIGRLILAPPILRAALTDGTLILALAPLLNLVTYYQISVRDGRTNDAYFQTVAGVETIRRAGERIYGERGTLNTYTLGGGRWGGHLTLAAHIYGWETLRLDLPQADDQIVPNVNGPLIVRPNALPLLSRLYRLEPVLNGPTGGAPIRLVYVRGVVPGLLAAGRQPTRDDIPHPPRPPRVEPYVTGVARPSSLQFAPDGRLFFAETQAGRVRIVDADGRLQTEPFVALPTPPERDQGVLGLALDPSFAENRYVYVFYSEADDQQSPLRNRLVRFTERDGRATEETAILDDLPINQSAYFNGGLNGGRIAFGPDGRLYVSIGAMAQQSRAADPNSLVGKILRIAADGSIPADNPIAGSPVIAGGFRDILGLAFHPGTGRLYAVDPGEDAFDELNLVRPGGDYGYPAVEGGPDGVATLDDPIWDSDDEKIGITGLAFSTGALFPEYTGDLFFCSADTGALRRVRLRGATLNQVEWVETVAHDCRLDVTNGPGGTLYFSDLERIFRLAR